MFWWILCSSRGMGLIEATRSGFAKYADFKGAATRSEYWYFQLALVLGSVILSVVRVPALSGLFLLLSLIPRFAVGARRNHDAGWSGWWQLVPLLNLIIALTPSKLQGNKYVADRTSAVPLINNDNVTGTSTYCTVCGKLRLPGQNFCAVCGTSLS